VPDTDPTKRPSVLLLAGEVRDAWTRALEEAGFEVRTTGWLDGVTAARLRRPDVVLVSADLPANARVAVTTAFRADDLSTIPIAVAGVSPGVAERESAHPLRADRYIQLPVTADRLAREVAETIRRGRVPWRRPPEQRLALALLGVGFPASRP
jgi:DNA-binding response OmpR family regulator